MRYPIILALLSLVVCSSALARLGETSEESIVRYGEVTSMQADAGLMMFARDGYVIVAHFTANRCDEMGFRKQPPGNGGPVPDMTVPEIDAMLEINGLGHKWVQQSVASLDTYWRSDGGDLLANYMTGDHMLVLQTVERSKQNTADQATAEKAKLKGF